MVTDVKAIVQVLTLQHERLYAQIWAIVGDAQLAEDVLQEVSILAVDKGVDVPNDGRLVLWLRRSARFKALEALRDRGRLPVTLTDELLEAFDRHWNEADSLVEPHLVEALRHCTQQLTPANQRLLTLRYRDGKKCADVAKLVGRSLDAVYQSLSRVHHLLRKCVEAKLKEGTLP
jgi:RNA polymerase sigma-70 factor (ECF subfamily)